MMMFIGIMGYVFTVFIFILITAMMAFLFIVPYFLWRIKKGVDKMNEELTEVILRG